MVKYSCDNDRELLIIVIIIIIILLLLVVVVVVVVIIMRIIVVRERYLPAKSQISHLVPAFLQNARPTM